MVCLKCGPQTFPRDPGEQRELDCKSKNRLCVSCVTLGRSFPHSVPEFLYLIIVSLYFLVRTLWLSPRCEEVVQ